MDSNNRPCYCDLPSRVQISGPGARVSLGVHFVCSYGTCDFYEELEGEGGGQATARDEGMMEMLTRQSVRVPL